MTSAGKLNNKKIIHAVGPIWNVDEEEESLLLSCVINTLILADRNGMNSISIPAISCLE